MHTLNATQGMPSRLGQTSGGSMPPSPDANLRVRCDHAAATLSRAFLNLSEIERKISGAQQSGSNCAEAVPTEESLAILVIRITNLAESLEQSSDRINMCL